MVDEVCITFSESDVVVLPLELFCRPRIHTVNIGERPLLCLPDVTILRPTYFPGEMWSAEDRLDLMWGFCFKSIILWPGPLIIDIVLEVPMANELLDLILEGDALLNGITDAFVEPAVFVLVPLGTVSTQRVKLLEYPRLLCSHENVLL